MKKILLGAAVMLGLASCSENEVLNQTQQAISFDKAQFGNSLITKVDYENLESNKDLGVYCYNVTPGAEGLYFNPLALAYTGTEWKLSSTQYWPASTTTLEFWAYGPSNIAGVTHSATAMTITYTADGTTDLIATPLAVKATKEAGSTEGDRVQRFLKHILSQVQFNAILAVEVHDGDYGKELKITI